MARTNPKLTTNIKIVSDSKNQIFLESIDANSDLTRSIFKGYQISPNGSYSYDLARFYSRSGNSLPESIAYRIFEESNSTVIKDRYKDQFDFTYALGMTPKNSKLYTEEFSIFAPLWLEKDTVPDYFVIFKIEGPVTVNSKEYRAGSTAINLDTDETLKSLIEDPEYFFQNIVQKARVIKTFDLTDKSSIGKYIRNHVNDNNFPESPFYLSFDKDENSYWSGISYRNGGFTKKGSDISSEFGLIDKTIIESEDFITDGFKRNGIVCANILNIEFLFDDSEQEKYKFSRYFGLYVSETELGKFTLSNERLLEDTDPVNLINSPIPTTNQVGNSLIPIDSIQTNPDGIKIYPEVNASAPYSGRLLTFNELQNSRLGYVKDKLGIFYSVDNVKDWSSVKDVPGTGLVTDTDYLRIKNTSINWKNFTGLDDPFAYIPSEKTAKQGRPAIAFKVIDTPNTGDEIRLQFTDHNNPDEAPFVDTHTLDAFNTIPASGNNGLTYSNLGTIKQISNAIVNAINQIEVYQGESQPFKALLIGDEILVFCKIDSSNWNKLKISFFSTSNDFPFEISNEYIDPTFITNYRPSPLASSLLTSGHFLEANFSGGNDNPKSRAIVERKYVQEFRDALDTIYIKTKKGYQTTGDYSLYLDEVIKSDKGEIIGFNNYEKYYVINLEDSHDDIEFGSSKKLALQKKTKNTNGYFTIFPVRDFDFDFFNQDYKKLADSSRSKLYNWYTGATGINVPIFNYNSLVSTSKSQIDDILGATSSFAVNGEFQSLIGYQNDLTDENEEVFNEYDRLKENYIDELALSSRVVPFINKWSYDNESKDVRENDYRLNVDQSFGYNNFSPDFDQIERTPKFFTHEWYYLQKYPPYMTFDEKLNSYSYFDEDIYFTGFPLIGSTGSTAFYQNLVNGTGVNANLLSINEDYFLSYFTRETVDGLSIPREFKYSIFSNGTKNKGSETLFRGAKIEIIDRSEYSSINYNKDGLRLIYNEKYNGYKFSAVLTYGNAGNQIFCIKNDKWKTISLIISADLDDVLTQYKDTTTNIIHKFVDRAHLYTLQNKLGLNPGGTAFNYDNKTLSGVIVNWTDEGTYFNVKMNTDSNGNAPVLNSELSFNDVGAFDRIKVSYGGFDYEFSGIFELAGSSFKCTEIHNLPLLVSPITPNAGINSLSSIQINNWQGFAAVYSAPFNYNPIYLNGGFNAFNSVLEPISFANIQENINIGSPEVRYISVDESGNVSENTFVLNVIKPDYPVKSSYLERKILDKTSEEIQIPASILGYEITASDRVSFSPISRYRGNYSPRWKDLIKFIDTNDIKSEGLDYNNIQIFDDITYIKDNDLGKIKNISFNKVNPENPKGVLSKFFSEGTLDSANRIYPLLGEMSIDKQDFYIFKSSWDSFYYKKYFLATVSQPIIGTRESKEEKSFFGSKTISIPNEVRIENFALGVSDISELIAAGSIDFVPGSIIKEEKISASKKEINLDFYITKSLEEWLIIDGFTTDFDIYVDSDYSFGNPGIDDDARLYIRENIFDRYSIKEVLMWEKNFLPKKFVVPSNQIVTNLTDSQKSLNGYVLSKNFKYLPNQTGGLDFKVIYTIPKGKRTSICFTVILEKK